MAAPLGRTRSETRALQASSELQTTVISGMRQFTTEEMDFIRSIIAQKQTLTARHAVKQFTGKELTDRNYAYDQLLFKDDFSEEKTKQAAANYFGLGCQEGKRNEWIATFGQHAVYTVKNQEYAAGFDNIREHLLDKFKQADFLIGKPLTFKMETETFVHQNMACAVVDNKLPNGKSFTLISLDFFDENGKVIFNGDFYSYYGAAFKIMMYAAGRLLSCGL